MPPSHRAHHRLIILGAGTAGLSAWKQASVASEDVLLIDPGPLGTTCARVGCMPSKALLQLALDVQRSRRLHEEGHARGPAPAIDTRSIMARVRSLRDYFTAGPIRATEGLGERFIHGAARFTGSDRIQVNGREYSADAFILATGTRPFVPPEWPDLGSRLVTSDSLFELEQLPPRIAVIGSGAIGCEIGLAFALLGAEVRLYNHGSSLAGIADEEIRAVMHAALSETLQLQMNTEVRPRPSAHGVLLETETDAWEADLVVAAVGRRAELGGMSLENLGVELDAHGLPVIDPRTLKVPDRAFWLAGDVSGLRPLMHEAADEGRLAAWQVFNPDAECMARRTPMGIVFTDPQAAWAGQRGSELPADHLTGTADFSRQGRATIMGYRHGLMKIHASKEGVLIGAEMVCAGAEHMAHELAWLIQQRTHVVDALKLPFYHPVVEEGLRTALHGIRRQLPARERRPDLPLCSEVKELPGT